MELSYIQKWSDFELDFFISACLGWKVKGASLFEKCMVHRGPFIVWHPNVKKPRWYNAQGCHLLPRYSQNLDRMHEAEKSLLKFRKEVLFMYHDTLAEVVDVKWEKIHVDSTRLCKVISSTARQRAEAFAAAMTTIVNVDKYVELQNSLTKRKINYECII